jgi:sugar/nucleoside kinase (ribokinase family)
MSKEELSRGINLLKNLRAFGEVILSANENEFHILAAHTGVDPGRAGNCQSALNTFRNAAAIDQVILRTLPAFYFSSSWGELCVENQYVEDPQYLTGAGDAQNGGICLGLLAGLPVEEALMAGVWAGNCYIRTGTVEPQIISVGVKV